jgi:hypothetical protein
LLLTRSSHCYLEGKTSDAGEKKIESHMGEQPEQTSTVIKEAGRGMSESIASFSRNITDQVLISLSRDHWHGWYIFSTSSFISSQLTRQGPYLGSFFAFFLSR